MAQTLTNETSLLRQQERVAKEQRTLKMIYMGEWIAAVGFLLFGAVLKFVVAGNSFPLVLGGFLFVLALGHHVRRKENEEEYKNIEGGRAGERKMAKQLDEQLANDHFVLNDLGLQVGSQKCQIDHLVVAPSGMFVIETKNWNGKISGSIRDFLWKVRPANGKPFTVRNPVKQCRRQKRILCEWLKGTTLVWENVYTLVVFINPHAELNILDNDKLVFRPNEAVQFINDFCFNDPILSKREVEALAKRLVEEHA